MLFLYPCKNCKAMLNLSAGTSSWALWLSPPFSTSHWRLFPPASVSVFAHARDVLIVFPSFLYSVCTLSRFWTAGEREREASNVCHKIRVCLENFVHLICFHSWKEELSKEDCCLFAIENCGKNFSKRTKMVFSAVYYQMRNYFSLVFSNWGICQRMELVGEVFCWVLEIKIGEW